MDERARIYEREKLYEEVWKEPMVVIAKRYGISDVALAKTCRKLAVPLPPRGYWARIRAGRKAPPRPPLPPYESPVEIQTTDRVRGRPGVTVSKVTDEKSGHSPAISTITIPETSDSPSRTEGNTVDKKRNPRKTSPKEFPEYLYCTIDGWQRTFRGEGSGKIVTVLKAPKPPVILGCFLPIFFISKNGKKVYITIGFL